MAVTALIFEIPKSTILTRSLIASGHLEHEDVLRLQVAMDDVVLVRGHQSRGDLLHVGDDPRQRKRLRSLHHLGQLGPVEELHDEVRLAALGRAEVDHLHDVRVLQRATSPSLLAESAAALRRPRRPPSEAPSSHSDRRRRLCETSVNLAHPARADLANDAVGADDLTGRQRWCHLCGASAHFGGSQLINSFSYPDVKVSSAPSI